MTKKYKAHPLMIINFIRPTLIVLVFPLISGIIQYIKIGTVDGILGLEVLLLFAIFLLAVLRWRNFSLFCDSKKNVVTIKYGFVFKRLAKINVSKLSSVQTAQNPVDAIFRAVTYRINTESGVTNKADFEFKLSKKDSDELSHFFYGESQYKEMKYSFLRVAVMAAATSSAATGLIAGVPIINRAGRLLGLGLSQLFNEINNISSQIKTYFPPVVNTITLIILFSYLLSFLYSFLKYVNFRLLLAKNKLQVQSGFIVRTKTAFKKAAINDIKIEQTVLMMLLRRFAMKVSVGGYGDSKSESEVVIPLGRNKEMKRKLAEYFPFFYTDEKGIRPKQNNLTKSRFLFWPVFYLISVVLLSIWLSLRFTDFTRFILFLTFITICFIFCYAYICQYEYAKGTISLGDNIFARSNRGLRTYELYCPKEKIGEIKIIRFPMDYIYKTCRIRVSVRSENADSVRVRHLDYKTVVAQVYKTFNIE